MARNALGRGLGALIRDPEQAAPVEAQPALRAEMSVAPIGASGPLLLDIDLLDPSPYQPRTRFEDGALEELAQSIRATGIIQPLVARRVGARYELIAGERRWRAAQRAGLLRVPAVLREVGDEEALELSLVENLQREDLNPVEQARAFERLIEQFHLTQDEVAERTGKDRATVANSVRLLALNPGFLQWIEEGRLTAGHGRALLAIDDQKLRLLLAQKASQGKLTVRQLERMATRRAKRSLQASRPELQDPNRNAALNALETHIGTKVFIHMPSKGKAGQLILEFYEEAQLEDFYKRLMS